MGVKKNLTKRISIVFLEASFEVCISRSVPIFPSSKNISCDEMPTGKVTRNCVEHDEKGKKLC